MVLYLRVDFPWVFSQFGQWYMSMSGASSSSTPTQLKRRRNRHHYNDRGQCPGPQKAGGPSECKPVAWVGTAPWVEQDMRAVNKPLGW